MKHTAYILIFAALLGSKAYGQDRSTAGLASPDEPNAVSAGTRFIVGLQDNLDTKDAKSGKRFHGRTLQPIATTNGAILSPGMEVRGHVDKVETAHQTGRARMWLTFDEIRTPSGWSPLVADLVDIPGVHSVKVDYDREGEIEIRTSHH
jgi:hypothetical protein